MVSQEILRIANVAQTFKARPSDLLGLYDDPYAAFCFDEACAVVISRLRSGDELKAEKQNTPPESENLLDFLRDFEQRNAK